MPPRYEAGENFEELYIDPETNQRYDSRGNPITVAPQSFNPNAVAYYAGDRAQPLRYADVYPGPVNVHQNQALTDFAVRHELDSGLFIAPEIAPVKTVSKRSDIFYKVASQGADVVRNPDDLTDVRAIGATANEVQQGFDTDTYTAVDRAVRDFIPDKLADNADEVLEVMASTTRFLTSFLEYRWDARLLTNILTTGNFTNATLTAAGGGKVGAATTSLRYIHLGFNSAIAAMIQANLMYGPTHVVMASATAQRIAASPEVAGQVVYGLGATYTVQGGWAAQNYGLPAMLYGVRPVIAPHVKNTAKKGQTASFSDILTDNLIFLRVEAPGRRTRNAVTTFRVGGLNTRTYRDEGRKGTYVEVEMDQVEKITNSYSGYILTDVI